MMLGIPLGKRSTFILETKVAAARDSVDMAFTALLALVPDRFRFLTSLP